MSPSVKQRAVLWPYILALGCLFALSLVAPRGWQRADGFNGTADRANGSATPTASDASGSSSGTAAIVHPTPEQSPTIDGQPTAAMPAPLASTSPQPEEPAEKVADQWPFGATAELNGTGPPPRPTIAPTDPVPQPTKSIDGKSPATGTPTLAPALPTTADPAEAKPDSPAVVQPLERKTTDQNSGDQNKSELGSAVSPAERIACKPAREPETREIYYSICKPSLTKSIVRPRSAPEAAAPVVPPPAAAPLPPASPSAPALAAPPPAESSLRVQSKPSRQPIAIADLAWPLPKSLLARLHELAKRDGCSDWAEAVRGRIEQLSRLSADECAEANAQLQELRRLAEKATPLAARASHADVAEIRQTQYALSRRLDIWDEVCAARQQGAPLAHKFDSDRRRMQLCLADIRALAETAGIGSGFTQNLMLDTLADLSAADDLAAIEQRQHVARQVLTHLEASREAAKRRIIMEAGPIAALDQQLRRWAAEPLPSDELLSRLEKYESGNQGADARRIAQIRQELAWSAEPAEVELARRLEMHYRNANVRIVLTGQLLQRLLPEPKPTNDPVNETILGAAVSGRSMTSAQLSLRLLPDQSKWKMGLETTGTIDSETLAVAGPVTFRNRGNAQFTARKYIAVDADGVRVKPAVVDVDTDEKLVGLYTSYDSIPLLRSVVRNYALSQRDKQQDEVHREGEDRVREKACARVDSAIEPRLVEAEQNFRDRVVDPLVKLALDPTAVAMETTEQRLTLRARLAGEDQLAAHTARPEAPADSLASGQIHESAINNLLDHLDLAGRTFTLAELHHHLTEKLSRAEAKLPDDLPDGVEITFATSDPARVHCANGRLELVLQIAGLRQGRRHWHDFDVRAIYRPDPQGLSAAFEREGVIELGGQYQGKPEVALRGIFSKVLSKQRKLNLLPATLAEDTRLAGLEVTQLDVEEGWIALAIGPSRAATVGAAEKRTPGNVTK